jgi:hypothetical protein
MMHHLRLASLLLVVAFLDDAALRADDVFVAVGYGGRRMVSTDGLHWEITAEWAQPGGDDGNNLMSAAYAENKFVVTGGGGGGNNGAGHILVSTDGRTWREVHQAKNRINPIVYGNGRFVVGAPNRRLMWSDDAETWHDGATIDDKLCTHFRGGAYGNDRFVFVGNHGGGGGPHWVAVSPDGESITGVRTDLPGHGSIVFGADRFLMLTAPSNAGLLSSTDGLDWKEATVAPDAKLNWLVRTDDAFLVGAGKAVYRSTDGVTWQATELTAPRGNVKWTDGRRFIASAWPGKMAFSPDGKSWSDAPPLTPNGINRVVRGARAE